MEEHKHHDGHHKLYAHHGKDSISITKLSMWKTIAGILAILLVASIYTEGFGIGQSKDAPSAPTAPSAPAAPTQPVAPAAPSSDMKVLADDDTIKGEVDAPVTIVEWSDFECPFCARFYSQTLPSIQEEYIDTGKVKFVHRDFPLGFHANAQKAAEAAECAGEQGKYWEMHDRLYEDGVKGGVTQYKAIAEELGLDQADFDECLDSGAMAEEVKKDMADGQANGIKGTPGFIINGKAVSGAQPFENFKAIIDAELA